MAARNRFCARERVGNSHQFNVEDKFCLWRDGGQATVLAVRELIRNEQAALASNTHAFKADVPAADDAPRALREGDWGFGLAVGHGVAR